jgi:hypothetical protein
MIVSAMRTADLRPRHRREMEILRRGWEGDPRWRGRRLRGRVAHRPEGCRDGRRKRTEHGPEASEDETPDAELIVLQRPAKEEWRKRVGIEPCAPPPLQGKHGRGGGNERPEVCPECPSRTRARAQNTHSRAATWTTTRWPAGAMPSVEIHPFGFRVVDDGLIDQTPLERPSAASADERIRLKHLGNEPRTRFMDRNFV